MCWRTKYKRIMAKYFTFAELIASDVAKDKGIDNTPNWAGIDNLRNLTERVLEKVRMLWGAPIIVNSGYRSNNLNVLVGGSANSQHKVGKAADITTGSIEGNRKLFAMLEESDIEFDQLIDEYDYKWLHISYDAMKVSQRRQILHLK